MYTVVFYARFLIHHLTDLCDRLYELTDGNFYFVETEKMPVDRKKMGYKEEGLNRKYCINIRESDEKMEFALRLARESDIAIIGCGSYRFMNERLKYTNKLTFKLKERLYKKGIATRYDPAVKADMYEKHQKFLDKNVLYLSAGVFTATDVHFLGYSQERILKWGYFPPFREHQFDEFAEAKRKDYVDIIWVGRFMQTKYPQNPIRAMHHVVKKHKNVRLSYIGGGELEEEMRMLIEKYQLQDHVFFEGYLPAAQVRDRMMRADICLCSSGYEEGWGATIGEAMNEGCMVIASAAAGSTGYLVQPEENGLIFPYTNTRALAECICKALEDPDRILPYGWNGYQKIRDTWNGFVAADRFYETASRIIEDCEWDVFESGPCSLAPIVHNMKELVQWKHAYTPKKTIRIAIDGLSGCGKSTLAKELAKRFQLLYIDSGALYRLTAHMLKRSDDITDADMAFLNEVEMCQDGDILWKGSSYLKEIMSPEVKNIVSLVAQNPVVRDHINSWIREKARDTSVVMDGRDIGSVVLPDAEIKIYLHCSIEYRMHNWRMGQMERFGRIDPEEEKAERENLEKRDYDDQHRHIAPLVCVKDAWVLDLEQYGVSRLIRTVSDRVKRRVISK